MEISSSLIQVYSKRVAFELRKLGYKIVGTTPNEKFPRFDIYLFKKEAGIESKLEELTKRN